VALGLAQPLTEVEAAGA